jgi:hypothetical protein
MNIPKKIPLRPLALGLLVLGFSAIVLGRAQAGGSHFYPPVADPVVKEECGSCHLAFRPVDAAGQLLETHDGRPEESLRR